MDAVIQTEGLGKRYGEKWALADCSLRVPTGTMAGLIGPNGAGKTTLLSMITGMLPPTAGRIPVPAVPRPRVRGSCRRWGSWHKTPRCTRACRSPIISSWART